MADQESKSQIREYPKEIRREDITSDSSLYVSITRKMDDFYGTKKDHKFILIKPLDESLAQELNLDSTAFDGQIIGLIKEYLIRRGKKCALCSKRFNRRDLTIDRRKPKSQGGKDNLENLQLLCNNCSELKGESTMLETRKRLRLKKTQKTV